MDLEPRVQEVAEELGDRALEWVVLAGGFRHRTVRVRLRSADVLMRFGQRDPSVEAAVMRLAAAEVPVPEVLLERPGCLVVEYVPGTLLADVLADPGPPDMAALGEVVGKTVAKIGTPQFSRPGFFTGPDLDVSAQPPWSEQLVGVARDALSHMPPQRLSESQRRDWLDVCAEAARRMEPADVQARLVHGDVNPKNILVRRLGAQWQVAALLDWEFAHSGCPYSDAANLLRFRDDYPPPFVASFATAYEREVVEPRADWYPIGQALDVFSLSQLLAHDVGHPVADRVERLVREALRDGYWRPLNCG